MGRPKSDDPKRAFTLRLPSSVLAIYEAAGADWRAKAEAVLIANVTPKPVAPEPAAPPAIHVAVPVFERPKFNPQPKTGKTKR